MLILLVCFRIGLCIKVISKPASRPVLPKAPSLSFSTTLDWWLSMGLTGVKIISF